MSVVLKESFIDAGANYQAIYNTPGIYQYAAQTFTAQSNYTIEQVSLLMFKTGTPGTLTVEIRETSAGKPTSSVLCSGTIDGNTFTTDTNGEYENILFGSGIELTASTMYAIVVYQSDSSSSNKINWIYKSAGGYTDGSRIYWTGTGWTILSSDFNFKNWGKEYPVPFSCVDGFITSQTAILIVNGTQLIETVSNSYFLESGNLTVTGVQSILAQDSIIFSESASLTISGSQYFEAFDKITFSQKGQLTSITNEIGWPPKRSQTYNQEEIWGFDPILNIYRWINQDKAQDILAISGGRYHNQLIVVGHKCIFYSEI
jgi:hypothetical protein